MSRGRRRILLMARQLTSGGSERQMTETAIGLKDLGFETHVACFDERGPRAEELRAAEVPILPLPVTSFVSPSALVGAWRLGRYIRKYGIELVHTFDPPLTSYGVPVAKAWWTPKVLSSQRTYRSLVPHYFVGATDKMVDGIVVNCEAMRRHLIDDEGLRPELIHLCYNSIDTSRFYPAPQERVQQLAGASLVIGVVCVLRPEKGLPTLVEAFAKLHIEFAGLRLLVVGNGPERQALERQIDGLGIKDACVIVPEAKDVVPWMRQIDIFVLPTLSEALSNSLMEAMACGCCAIATRVGGNGELVTPDSTGLLFQAGNVAELAERLRRLIGDPELRQTMAAAGAGEIARKFSRPVSLSRMAGIYRLILDS